MSENRVIGTEAMRHAKIKLVCGVRKSNLQTHPKFFCRITKSDLFDG